MPVTETTRPASTEPAEIAARAFVAGAIEAFMPEIVVEPISGPGIGTYERMEHCQRETARLRAAHTDAIVARCSSLAEQSRRLRHVSAA